MKVQLIYIGAPSLSDEEFAKKISYHLNFEIRRLKPKKLDRSSRDAKRDLESSQILEALLPTDFVIACDEKGQEFSSIDFSKRFVRQIEAGSKRIIFVIGGAYGLNESVRQRANLKLSLSKLTFNHEVARLVVLEQIYRALCIWKNIPYHND